MFCEVDKRRKGEQCSVRLRSGEEENKVLFWLRSGEKENNVLFG